MAPAVNALPDLPEENASLSLSWKENPVAKMLLDALVSILKEEYIQTAKNNPEIFSK